MSDIADKVCLRAVFVDRDGVLNRAIIRNGRPYPPLTLEALEILPGVPEAVRGSAIRAILLLERRISLMSLVVN